MTGQRLLILLVLGVLIGIGAMHYLHFLIRVENHLPNTNVRADQVKLLVESWRKRNFLTPIYLRFAEQDLNVTADLGATDRWLVTSEFSRVANRYTLTLFVDPEANHFLAVEEGALTPLANTIIRSKLFSDDFWFRDFVTIGGR